MNRCLVLFMSVQYVALILSYGFQAKLDGEWILYDDTSNVIFCFRIPIDIQN